VRVAFRGARLNDTIIFEVAARDYPTMDSVAASQPLPWQFGIGLARGHILRALVPAKWREQAVGSLYRAAAI
jgi:hypothetical protein